MKISLVIPVKNEADSLENLCASIVRQTRPPDEIILVDGGSTDATVGIARRIAAEQPQFRLIETPQASPGKGRNIGTENANFEWIAYTDAGIRLDDDWLEKMVEKVVEDDTVDIVYGNYAPEIGNYFEKIAAFTYVPAQTGNRIRAKFTASYMIRRQVWEKVGGFPDWRAAEDLVFMEAAENLGFKFSFAPDAQIHWQLCPDTASAFRKFALYSKHNVWAGRQWDWHYGVLKQYLVTIPFLLLTLFHSWWWLSAVVLWLFARTLKRIAPYRYEFGWSVLFDPLLITGTAFLILVIDAATFAGWGQAILEKKR